MADYLRSRDDFANAVWKVVGSQSAELKAVVQAVRGYHQIPNVIQLRSVKETLATWKRARPDEYRTRFVPIQTDFERDLSFEESRYVTRPDNNAMHWVQAVSARLDAFKEYAVGDVVQFRGNCAPWALSDCLARYADFIQADPDPPRMGPRINAAVSAGDGSWNAGRLRLVYNSITYQTPRVVHYTVSPDGVKLPKLGPPGAAKVRSLGSAICTQFAYAAAHVLTDGRTFDSPRVELVAWSGPGILAHCFVIVGRRVANAGEKPDTLPPPDEWGADCVVVDAWLAALGHKAAYRLQAGDYPYPGFLEPVNLVMVRSSQKLLDWV